MISKKISPILTVMFLDQTCLSIIFPVMTFVFFDKQSHLFPENTSASVRSMWYGICIALPHIMNIVVTPCLSALSDVFGRKKIILLATLGAFLIAMMGAFSILLGCFSLFMVGCILQGIFSRMDPVAVAAMGDLAPRDKKIIYMAYLQSAISMGACVGPMIGGFFATRYFFKWLNFSLPFMIAGLFAALAFLYSLFVLKETLIEKSPQTFLHHVDYQPIKKLFTNPIVRGLTIILLLSQFSWRIYYQYIPPILKTELGFNAHQIGLFVGMIAFWLSIATTVGVRFLEKFFLVENMLRVSLYLVLFGMLLTILFCFLHDPWWLWVTVVPIAMGDVIAFSCITTLYSNAVPKEDQGKVMGVCYVVVAMIWALTGLVGGALMSLHPLLPLMIAPIGVLVASVLSL